MKREEFLEVQLRQAEQALEATRRMKELAEQQYRRAISLLHRIALTLVAPEWNDLRREQDVNAWSPEQLAAWIVETVQAKLNRLEILAAGGLAAPSGEEQHLRERIRQLEAEIQRLQDARDEVLKLREENRRLRAEVQTLSEKLKSASPEEVPVVAESTADPEIVQWIEGASNGAIDLLKIIGSTGHSLREDIARAGGRLSARQGSIAGWFQELLTGGMIVEESFAAAEWGGRFPNVVRLSPKGQTAYRVLTGLEPVESEFDRLLQRHKSPEQTLLALRARQVLEEFGAEVNLFPEPVVIRDGRVFQVDLVAILDGQQILVECERMSTRTPRLDKWSLYRAATNNFYFFVPNQEILERLTTELNLWAYRRSDEAQGVVVHIHRMSARREKDTDGDRKLWHYVRPLAGTAIK